MCKCNLFVHSNALYFAGQLNYIFVNNCQNWQLQLVCLEERETDFSPRLENYIVENMLTVLTEGKYSLTQMTVQNANRQSIVIDLADIINIAHCMRINNKKFGRIKFFHLQVRSGEFQWPRQEELDHTHAYLLCMKYFL